MLVESYPYYYRVTVFSKDVPLMAVIKLYIIYCLTLIFSIFVTIQHLLCWYIESYPDSYRVTAAKGNSIENGYLFRYSIVKTWQENAVDSSVT